MKMKYYVWFILLHFHFDSKRHNIVCGKWVVLQGANATYIYFEVHIIHIHSEHSTLTHTKKRHSYASPSSSSCCAECKDRQQGKVAMAICASRKIGPTSLRMCLFDSSVSFARRYSSQAVFHGNIIWIRYVCYCKPIGWTHKLRFIMPCNSLLLEYSAYGWIEKFSSL